MIQRALMELHISRWKSYQYTNNKEIYSRNHYKQTVYEVAQSRPSILTLDGPNLNETFSWVEFGPSKIFWTLKIHLRKLIREKNFLK